MKSANQYVFYVTIPYRFCNHSYIVFMTTYFLVLSTNTDPFWENHQEQRHEGMLPKLAIVASNIDELQHELLPIAETVLNELNIPTSRILVNVGDPKITTNDELREFNNLDTWIWQAVYPTCQ